jgi:hypothetical protein
LARAYRENSEFVRHPGDAHLHPRGSGLNKVVFRDRISRSKQLALGAYTLQTTALNSAGKRLSPRALSFSIVK